MVVGSAGTGMVCSAQLSTRREGRDLQLCHAAGRACRTCPQQTLAAQHPGSSGHRQREQPRTRRVTAAVQRVTRAAQHAGARGTVGGPHQALCCLCCVAAAAAAAASVKNVLQAAVRGDGWKLGRHGALQHERRLHLPSAAGPQQTLQPGRAKPGAERREALHRDARKPLSPLLQLDLAPAAAASAAAAAAARARVAAGAAAARQRRGEAQQRGDQLR